MNTVIRRFHVTCNSDDSPRRVHIMEMQKTALTFDSMDLHTIMYKPHGVTIQLKYFQLLLCFLHFSFCLFYFYNRMWTFLEVQI